MLAANLMLANLLQSAVTLAAEFIDFAVKTSNHIDRFLDRRCELVWFALPPPDAVDLGHPAAHLGVNLLAKLALSSRGNRLHDQLHAARLANSVLLGTVLSEVAPLPVATGKAVLVEEAHVSGLKSWGYCCLTLH